MLRLWAYAWAFPMTLIGLLFIPPTLASGGKIQVVDGVLEGYGPWLQRLFSTRLPLFGSGAAMTLGHVILGRDAACLARSRAHERVHVRQFERWGVLLLPMYVLAGLWARVQGRDPYLHNPFEHEAYQAQAIQERRP